jgi:16S rRNA (guanine527-N7)-methyltransferase
MPTGSVARKGSGETRPRTERGTPDRRPGLRTNERRGRLSGGSRAPVEECPDRPGGPPPTRVPGPAAFPPLPTDVSGLPELPPAYDRALGRGLLALGMEPPPEARAAMDGHVRLLLAWNAAINLTGITDPVAVALNHVIDSLTAASLVAGAHTIVDLGSGGGFPGLPLAVILPAASVTLVESVAKKAAFLEAAVGASGLAARVTVRATRAESLPREPGTDVVVARAVGSLADLVELAMPLLVLGGRLVAWKRGDLADELAAGRRAARALGGDPPVVRPAVRAGSLPELDGHVLVEIRKARQTPVGYPRDPRVRRSRPWSGTGR